MKPPPPPHMNNEGTILDPVKLAVWLRDHIATTPENSIGHITCETLKKSEWEVIIAALEYAKAISQMAAVIIEECVIIANCGECDASRKIRELKDKYKPREFLPEGK